MAWPAAPDTLPSLPDLPALRALTIDERTRLIERFLCQQLNRALDVPPAHRISAERSLRGQGMSSLMALQLQRVLEHALGVDVPAGWLLTHDKAGEAAAALAVLLDDAPLPTALNAPHPNDLTAPQPSR